MSESNFVDWLIRNEDKVPGSANSYSRAINELSEHYNSNNSTNIDIYKNQNESFVCELIDLYNTKGVYSKFGSENNGRRRAAIKAFLRYVNNAPKIKFSNNKTSKPIINFKNNLEEFSFDEGLVYEAQKMSDYYKMVYCLEKSIRRMVEEVLFLNYGEDWWKLKISENIKKNVDKKIRTENARIFSKKSQHRIDYTTFGELRIIVKSNWNVFSNRLKHMEDFNHITESLNVIRNSIAHSILLPEDEVTRLNLAMRDWFRLLKNT